MLQGVKNCGSIKLPAFSERHMSCLASARQHTDGDSNTQLCQQTYLLINNDKVLVRQLQGEVWNSHKTWTNECEFRITSGKLFLILFSFICCWECWHSMKNVHQKQISDSHLHPGFCFISDHINPKCCFYLVDFFVFVMYIHYCIKQHDGPLWCL